MIKKQQVCFIVFFMMLCNVAFAQDVFFDQTIVNKTNFNPAFNAYNQQAKFTIQYKNQWANQQNSFAFNKIHASFLSPLCDRSTAIGIIINGNIEGEGTLSQYNLALNYSKLLPFNNGLYAAFGFNAGAHYATINWEALTFSDQLSLNNEDLPTSNIVTMPDNLNNISLNVNFGGIMAYQNNNQEYLVGINVNHIGNQPNIGFYEKEAETPMRTTIYLSYLKETEFFNFVGASKANGSIGFISKLDFQHKFKQAMLGLQITNSIFTIHTAFTGKYFNNLNQHNLHIFLGLQPANAQFGLSYNIPIGGMQTNVHTFEISYAQLINENFCWNFFGLLKDKQSYNRGGKRNPKMKCHYFKS